MAGAQVPCRGRCGESSAENNDNAKRNFVQHFYLLAEDDNKQARRACLWRNVLSLICDCLSGFSLICCNADLEVARRNLQIASDITGM